MSRFISEPLAKQDRSAFQSGNDRIDRYFQQNASQDVKRGYTACYLLVEQSAKQSTKQSTSQIAGFYTLSSHSVALTEVADQLARKLPRYPSVPAALIGWMGRDANFRGQGIGPLLLADAINRLARAPLGIHAICADAIDDAAAAFYRRHQFEPLVSRPGRFYLPMKTALAAVAIVGLA